MSGRVLAWTRAVVVHDFGFKALSLLIAIALYALVHGAEDVQRTLSVPLTATLPEGTDRMLVSDLPDEVRVVVSGRSTVVKALQELEPLVIDLREVKGSYYYLEPEAVRLPAGVRAVRIVPDTIQLQWDRKAVVRRPVHPQLRGVPLEGFEAHVVRVEPAQVTLAGPLGRLGPLQQVRTETIDVRGLAPGRHVRWVPLERLGSLVRSDPSQVEVVLEVVPRRLLRRLRALPVRVPPGWRVEPSRVAVELDGPPELVSEVRPEALRVRPGEEGEGGMDGGPRVLRVEGLPQGVKAHVVPAAVTLTPEGRSAAPARSRRRGGSSSRTP